MRNPLAPSRLLTTIDSLIRISSSKTLDLVLQSYSVACELQLHAGHAPLDTLFSVGHKT
jgi:hypothetical protein